MQRTCKDCGKNFVISDGEINFFKSKGLELPKRCEKCRKSNKSNNSNKQYNNSSHNNRNQNNTYHNNGKNHKSQISLIAIFAVIGIILVILGIFGESNDSTSGGLTTTTYDNQYTTSDALTTTETDNQSTTSDALSTTETDNQSTTSEVLTTQISFRYEFRNDELFIQHYYKHGKEMGFSSAMDYLAAANEVIVADGVLTKLEEDNDKLYFLKSTNEFVVLSYDGYIRTYFIPDDGLDYFLRQ